MSQPKPEPPIDPSVIDELADRVSERLAPRLIDAIKAEGLPGPAARGERWLSALEVAQRLGVSREWVYEHAEELGASRIGNGARPRLRFPPGVAEEPRRREPSRPHADPGKRLAPRSGLIPIHPS